MKWVPTTIKSPPHDDLTLTSSSFGEDEVGGRTRTNKISCMVFICYNSFLFGSCPTPLFAVMTCSVMSYLVYINYLGSGHVFYDFASAMYICDAV